MKKIYLSESGIQYISGKPAKNIFKNCHHPQNDSCSERVIKNSTNEITKEKRTSQTSAPEISTQPLFHPWTFSHPNVISDLSKNSIDNNYQLITHHLAIQPL